MSDVKLFKLHPNGRAVELPGEAVSVERSLQTVIERDSEAFLGVKPVHEAIEDAEQEIKDLFVEIRTFIMALGDDVQEKQLKLYIAYRRIKNFVSVVVQKRALVIYFKLDPETVKLEDEFSRDVQDGHWGTGDLELTVRTSADLLKAQPLTHRSYDGS